MNTTPEAISTEATATPSPADLAANLAAERERSLQLAADFDSFRRRTARDADQRARTEKDALIRDLLPVVDNLERALASHAPKPASSLRTGIDLTFQQLLDVLRRHGVKPEENLGETFDPNQHEAINARFDANQPDDIILEVVQRGYRRGDEVVRPAKVIINDLDLAGNEAHGG